jgi:hypothetical protein
LLALCAAAIVGLLLAGSIARAGQSVTRTITLAWDASPTPNVIGYRLHYGQQSGNYSHLVDVGNQTSSDIPNLIEGTTYYFAVTAYAVDGAESSPSEEFHYMPNPALLLNLSTRAMVQSGDGVMIAGFIVGGMGEKKVIVRALGPTLTASGVKGVLADPSLELYGPSGLIVANDNWQNGNAAELMASGLAPSNSAEAAAVATLTPGNYSVIVRGKGGKTGLVLLEVYDAGM